MADSQTGVQTRSMTEAQRNNLDQQPAPEDNPTPATGNPTSTQNLDPQNPVLNPVVELTEIESDNLMEYVRTSSEINLDWYMPDLMNTRIRDMIKNRLPTHTSRNHVTIICPMPKDFFSSSTFEIDLKMGKIFTFQMPPEDIGITCQQEEFDLDLLRSRFQDDSLIEHGMEALTRIPSIKKVAPAADTMDLAEIEEKIYQLCTLWGLYVDASYELARKSKLPLTEAAKACRIYGLYISDILQQVDVVITIFTMENELRILKGRGHFPIPKMTPQDTKIDSQHLAKKTLDAADRELTEILQNIRESEERYEKEKERTSSKSK